MTYRFCPSCGALLSLRTIGPDNQQRLACSACDFVNYPNSRPCVGGLVVQDGQVLLAQRKADPDKGDWGIPGGFLENGEHPLDGVVRELRENMNLEQLSEGPMGVGTIIRRRVTRTGVPVEGTMEVVEFEPERTVATVIHDGKYGDPWPNHLPGKKVTEQLSR